MRIIAGLLLLASTTAQADVTRCSDIPADVAYDATDLPEATGDTGWFPSDSDVQLRITGQMIGETHVGMGLQPTACWTASGDMMVTARPREATGVLSSQYGADVHLYGQVHTSVLGYDIDWSGELPVPYIGDLLIAGTAAFDPAFAPVSVSDQTNPITILSTNLLSSIIDITGISGGLALQVKGAMMTTYQTTSIALAGGTITGDTAPVALAAPDTGYGPTLAATPTVSGVVTYAPSLVFDVSVNVSILHVSVVNYELFDVSLPLPSFDRQVTLTGAGAAIPLPKLGSVPDALGFASGGSQTLHVTNTGAAPLMIAQVSAPTGVSVAAVTIAPGGEGDVVVAATDITMLDTSPLVLETNDPSHGSITIALSSTADGEMDEQPVGHAGGCSTGGTASPLALLAVALLLRRRR